jgi:hypothetical protein
MASTCWMRGIGHAGSYIAPVVMFRNTQVLYSMGYSKLELQKMTERFLQKRNRNIIDGSYKPSWKKLDRVKKIKAKKRKRLPV